MKLLKCIISKCVDASRAISSERLRTTSCPRAALWEPSALQVEIVLWRRLRRSDILSVNQRDYILCRCRPPKTKSKWSKEDFRMKKENGLRRRVIFGWSSAQRISRGRRDWLRLWSSPENLGFGRSTVIMSWEANGFHEASKKRVSMSELVLCTSFVQVLNAFNLFLQKSAKGVQNLSRVLIQMESHRIRCFSRFPNLLKTIPIADMLEVLDQHPVPLSTINARRRN